MKAKGIGESSQEETVAGLIADYSGIELRAVDRAMLEYAVKLTRAPFEIAAEDVEQLRTSGFDDRGIHDICAITAYYAFVNRIADGLGVELEES